MTRVLILDPLWPMDVGMEALDGIDVTLEKTDRIEGDDVVAVLAAPEQTIPANLLELAPNVRLVGTCSTGYDNLPAVELSAQGVMCLHVKSYCDEEVAEHTITLAANLLRGVAHLDGFVREGGWWPYPREPRRLAGSRLGIVGFGRIGRLVAIQGDALRMEVVAYDDFVDEATMQSLGVQKVDLDTLIETSDVVTLHAPLLRSICVHSFLAGTDGLAGEDHKRLVAHLKRTGVRVIVPENCVQTYDTPVKIARKLGIPAHDGDLLHAIFLHNMAANGVEVVAKLR